MFLTVPRSGALRVPVRCPAQRVSTCSGRLEIASRRRHVLVARTRFAVASGGSARPLLRVTAAGARLLHRHPRVGAWLTLTPSGVAGARSQRRAVTLRRAGR
jgi:hypothetical protein